MLKLLQKETWQYVQKLHIHLLLDETIRFLAVYPKDTLAT